MAKIKILEVYEDVDYYDTVESQDLFDGDKKLFSVYNLSECPEDAIIGRDLFTADDYVKAVEYGMKLAKEGYTGVSVEYR